MGEGRRELVFKGSMEAEGNLSLGVRAASSVPMAAQNSSDEWFTPSLKTVHFAALEYIIHKIVREASFLPISSSDVLCSCYSDLPRSWECSLVDVNELAVGYDM